MKLSKEKMLRTAERVLKRTEAYQEKKGYSEEENYQILYLLKQGRNTAPDNVIAFAGAEEQVISFHPFSEDEPIWNWDFNFDGDLFEYLQSGYELVDMTVECHYSVWSTIEQWHESDIDFTKGMQKYLAYCKRSGITKEKLKYEGMDVLVIYDQKSGRTNSQKELER